MRSYYKNGFAKHYVRDHDVLRFETASNDVKGDYGINKAVKNVVTLREKLQGITERYQNVQQDILETFLDRGELRKLGEATLRLNGKRIPGFKLDHARQLAVMSSLLRFSHVAAGDTFTTAELHAQWISHLSAVSQTLRQDLRTAHRRASSSLSRRPNHDRRWAASTRQALPICCCRPGCIGCCGRAEACCLIQSSNENKILVGAPITV